VLYQVVLRLVPIVQRFYELTLNKTLLILTRGLKIFTPVILITLNTYWKYKCYKINFSKCDWGFTYRLQQILPHWINFLRNRLKFEKGAIFATFLTIFDSFLQTFKNSFSDAKFARIHTWIPNHILTSIL